MTAPVYRAVDAHSGRSLAAVLIELDAALQRCEVLDGENHALRALVDELRALARAQSEEIRSLNLQLDQARWKKAGW